MALKISLPALLLGLFTALFFGYSHLEKAVFSSPDSKIEYADTTAPVYQRPDSTDFSSVQQHAEQVETIQSLLVQQKGEQLAEHYFRGMDAGRKVNIKSASKSLMGLLAGIAVDEGLIEVDEPIGPYFEEYFSENPDPEKEAITIQDLLTMRAGLETTSFYNYGPWVVSPDWVAYALSRPLEEEPGGKMVYSTGTSHLLSVLLTKATGMSTREFAQQYLFEPMDILPGGWDRDPQGFYMGGNNVALRPIDMMKIGQMVLDKGKWNGRQIISESWFDESFQTYTRSNFNPYDYGYMWWKKEIGGYQSIFAWGFGGQYIFIFPELEGVIVITSTTENSDQSRDYKEPVFELVEESVLPRLLAKTAS